MSKQEMAEDKYVFTNEELIRKGIELTSEMKRSKELNEHRKEVDADYKVQIKTIDSNVERLTNKVSNGYEFRSYMCDIELDFERKERLYRRQDNGVVIKAIPLQSEDYKQKLFEDEALKKTEKRDALLASVNAQHTQDGQIISVKDTVERFDHGEVIADPIEAVIEPLPSSELTEEDKMELRRELGGENYRKWEAEGNAKQKKKLKDKNPVLVMEQN